MPDDALGVELAADGLGDGHKVHLGEGGLREEATRVYVLLCCKFIKRSDQLDITVRFNKECD